MTKSIDLAEPSIQHLVELLFDDTLSNLVKDGSEEIEQQFEYLLFKFERSLRPKKHRYHVFKTGRESSSWRRIKVLVC